MRTREKVSLNHLPLTGSDSVMFRHLPDRAARVKAAIRSNAVTVALSGNDEAIERFTQDVTATFGGDREAAYAICREAVGRHNVRFGHVDFIQNPWEEVVS